MPPALTPASATIAYRAISLASARATALPAAPLPAARSKPGKCDNLLDQIGGIAQRLTREMGVALRGARMQMAEQTLHHIERYAAVDQEARE